MKYLYFFIILTHSIFNILAQNTIYQEGDNLFEQGRYSEAFNIYSKLENIRLKDVVLKYKIGLCYLKSNNFKAKAIEYFNFCIKYQTNKNIPAAVYFHLGEAYHYNYEFIKAINTFNTYLEKTADLKEIELTKRRIQICENALTIYRNTSENITVKTMGFPVNSSYNDRSPIIANQGNLLVQGSSRPRNTIYLVQRASDISFVSEEADHYGIYLTYPKGIDWQFPDLVKVNNKKHVIPLFFKNNGKELLISISDDIEDQIFYTITYKSGNNWSVPKKLNKVINSPYKEQGACFANSGRTIYFASDRPGGQGGYDLYKVAKKNNKWTIPQNLGANINTKFDELNPYIHTDQTTLYFSSDGHNTMGGFDIFRSTKIGYNWTKAQNLGHPVNTPFNETACKIATDTDIHVTSDRHTTESIGKIDILQAKKINQGLPITMVNGIIKVLKDDKSIPITLQVIDRQTAQIQKYVYSPTDESGRFFMILKNDKHYTIEVLVDGNTIYSVTIDLPSNVYNYQLNKVIKLRTIKIFNQNVGETIQVVESDYKVVKHAELPLAKQVRDIKYEALLLLMERIIERTDVLGLSNINSLEEKTFEPVFKQKHKINEDFYYTPMLDKIADIIEQSDTSKLLNLAKSEERYRNINLNYAKSPILNKIIVLDHNLQYNERFRTLSPQDKENIQKLIDLLLTQRKLHLEVHWNPIPTGQEPIDLPTQIILAELEDLFKEQQLTTNRYTIIKDAAHETRVRGPAYYKQSELRLRVMER